MPTRRARPADGNKETSARSDLAAIVLDAIAANGLASEALPDFPHVRTSEVSGTIGTWQLFAQPDDGPMGVLVYSVFPVAVPEGRRQAVAELAARANYLLRYGDIELDFTDGEVRARTSARGGPEPPSFPTVAELVHTNIEVAELLFPLVSNVALEDADPSDEIDGLVARLGISQGGNES